MNVIKSCSDMPINLGYSIGYTISSDLKVYKDGFYHGNIYSISRNEINIILLNGQKAKIVMPLTIDNLKMINDIKLSI